MQLGKAKGWLGYLLKIFVGVAFVAAVAYQWNGKLPLILSGNDLWYVLKNDGWRWAGATLLLMPLNWWIEAKKWQLLLLHIASVDFKLAFRSVLSGVTLSILTPNRIGDFGGRIIHLPAENRAMATVLAFIGSYAQLTCTVLGGVLGGLAWMYHQPQLNLYRWFWPTMAIALAMVLFFWFMPKWLHAFMAYLKSKIHLTKTHVRSIPPSLLYRIFKFSAIRYLIFIIQYYFMFKCFGIALPFLLGIGLIGVMLLSQTFVPSTVVTDLGIRSGLSLWLFQEWGSQQALFSVVFLIWCINLIVPAVIGYGFILKNKLKW